MHIKLRKWVKILIFLIIIISLFFIYSRYIGTKNLIVKEYPIVDSNLPDNFYGLKIVHLSDIHYKTSNDKNELENIVNKINLLKPDIVILSGDLLNKNITYTNNDYEDLIKILNNIKCNIGKYAIKGDNDINNNKWEYIINNSNFNNLNNTYDSIYYNDKNPILLIGISSNYKKNHIEETIDSIYKNIKIDYNYSILVLHEPDFIKEIDYSKFNLVLAGHSLGGQIKLPFINGVIRPKFAKKYYDEYYILDNTKLYISSGIGTSKYKFRFLNKPSFNLYRLRNK